MGITPSAKQGIERREKIMECIVDFMMKHGYPPSTREICDMVGLKSTSSVNAHLYTLKKRGQIDYKDDSPRTITVPGIEYVDRR